MTIAVEPVRTEGEQPDEALLKARDRSLWSRWRHSPTAVIGTTVSGAIVALAVVSAIWTPYDPLRIPVVQHTFQSPSLSHLLGTDQYGRDILSRLMAGTQTTLYGGILAVLIAAVIGIPAGLYAAERGGVPSEAIMRIADLMFAFPALLIAMILAADFGGSTLTAVIAIGVAYTPIFARVTRSAALQVLNTDYILAARAAGRSRFAILRKHVFRNIVATVIVQMTLLFSLAVLAEAALTYLGLGTPPPTPSWGHMLQSGQNYLYTDPLLVVWPGLMIALTVLGFNLLGDGLREVFDPRHVGIK